MKNSDEVKTWQLEAPVSAVRPARQAGCSAHPALLDSPPNYVRAILQSIIQLSI
jgi:hypothetical protein